MAAELVAVVGIFVVAAVVVVRALRRRHHRAVVTGRLDAAAPGVPPLGTGPRLARLAVVAGVGALLGGPGAAVLGIVVVAGAGPVRRALVRLRRGDLYDAGVVELLAALARSLRSGVGAHVALAEAGPTVAGPVADDVVRLLNRLDQGMTLGDGLRRWSDERPRAAVRATAAALALGHETGGLRADIVDRVAAAARQRLDTRAEARGLATQARASAVVLAGAPLLFVVLGLVAGSGSSQFLLRTPIGLVCLVLGLALDVGAFAVMVRMVSGVGR